MIERTIKYKQKWTRENSFRYINIILRTVAFIIMVHIAQTVHCSPFAIFTIICHCDSYHSKCHLLKLRKLLTISANTPPNRATSAPRQLKRKMKNNNKKKSIKIISILLATAIVRTLMIQSHE